MVDSDEEYCPRDGEDENLNPFVWDNEMEVDDDFSNELEHDNSEDSDTESNNIEANREFKDLLGIKHCFKFLNFVLF